MLVSVTLYYLKSVQIRLRVGLGSEDDIKTNSFILTKYKRMSCVKEGVKQTERCIEI